jgi:uncharacterized membrane protein
LPLHGLRLVVGALLLVFGLQWLRKAILRASGHKAVHDEDEIYRKQLAAAAAAGQGGPAGLVPDWYGFTLAFKGVLLEGVEVVLIVLTFGGNQHALGLAALAAGCAVVVIAAAGLAVRAPLSRVPENTLKFVVGIMLTAFGVFWGAEGAQAHWPGADAALLVLVPLVAAWALALTAVLRRRPAGGGPASPPAGPPGVTVTPGAVSRAVRAAAAFGWDLLAGDDVLIAAAAVAGLAATWLLARSGTAAWWLLPLLVAAVLAVTLWRALHGRQPAAVSPAGAAG